MAPTNGITSGFITGEDLAVDCFDTCELGEQDCFPDVHPLTKRRNKERLKSWYKGK